MAIVNNPEEAKQIANDFRQAGTVTYDYITVTESASIKYFATRQAQIDFQGFKEYKTYRFKYTDSVGAIYIDSAGNEYVTTDSQVDTIQ